jgi:hypothetical protein
MPNPHRHDPDQHEPCVADQPLKYLAVLARQDLAIAVVGWAVTAVLPDSGEAPYAYTVGLTETGAPELVITGLPHPIAYALLDDAAQRVRHHGTRWHHRDLVDDLIADHDAAIIDGTANDLILAGTANARYGADHVRLQQIVWPDPDGHFPWDPGYRYPATVQPLLNPIT